MIDTAIGAIYGCIIGGIIGVELWNWLSLPAGRSIVPTRQFVGLQVVIRF